MGNLQIALQKLKEDTNIVLKEVNICDLTNYIKKGVE